MDIKKLEELINSGQLREVSAPDRLTPCLCCGKEKRFMPFLHGAYCEDKSCMRHGMLNRIEAILESGEINEGTYLKIVNSIQQHKRLDGGQPCPCGEDCEGGLWDDLINLFFENQ